MNDLTYDIQHFPLQFKYEDKNENKRGSTNTDALQIVIIKNVCWSH